MSRQTVYALRRFTQKLAAGISTDNTLQGSVTPLMSGSGMSGGPSDSAQRAMRGAAKSPLGNVLEPNNPADRKSSPLPQPTLLEQAQKMMGLGGSPHRPMSEYEAAQPELMGRKDVDINTAKPPAAQTGSDLDQGRLDNPGNGQFDFSASGDTAPAPAGNPSALPPAGGPNVERSTLQKLQEMFSDPNTLQMLGGLGGGGLLGYALGNAMQDEEDDSTPWLSTLAGAGLGTVGLPLLLQHFYGGDAAGSAAANGAQTA